MAFLTGLLDLFYIAWATMEANVFDTFDSSIPKTLASRIFQGAKTVAVGQRSTLFDYFFVRHFLRWTGGHKIQMNFPITIHPEKLYVENSDGSESIEVPIPESYIGHQNLILKLCSKFKRKGQIGTCTIWKHQLLHMLRVNCNCEVKPASDSVIFHAHGGGFTTLPSRSHETYLKALANSMEAPIVSVNYSLAPECPFPRACEELLYAYCWMRNNFSKLGTTGKKHNICRRLCWRKLDY